MLTPPKTVGYIISRLGQIKKDDLLLDPCVGPGVFVESLIKKGINPNNIEAYDIDPKYGNQLTKLGVSFTAKDTLLSISKIEYSKFDYILGNPPYLNKASLYVKEYKKQLSSLYGYINAHETYSMFIVNSMWRLKEGGKLGFITSDSFLTLRTHAKLRKFILNNSKIIEIALPPRKLFDDQNVSTSPAIIILEKCTGEKNQKSRDEHLVNIISRINNEDEYFKAKINQIKQGSYKLLPFSLFFIEVENEIIEVFKNAPKIKEVLIGYIGMHTHHNLKYIAAIENTELAELFEKKNQKGDSANNHKIISKKDMETGNWKPYLKRGGNDQYYRPIMEALDWKDDSILIYDIPKNVPFEQEGIIISGVSSNLAARYMPRGCYWDSNKAIGFILKNNKVSIYYMLGLLNSSLYNYLAKGIINNTSSIQITGIHSLPFIYPDEKTKVSVENLVSKIIESKKKDIHYQHDNEQKEIDEIIYRFHAMKFNFPTELKQKIDKYWAIFK